MMMRGARVCWHVMKRGVALTHSCAMHVRRMCDARYTPILIAVVALFTVLKLHLRCLRCIGKEACIRRTWWCAGAAAHHLHYYCCSQK